MIVYENSLITLTFAPGTDILYANWSNLELYSALEVNQTLQKLIEAMVDYNVKNLLIDARKGTIGMSDDEYRKIVIDFFQELGKTHIEKLARVMTSDPLREE